MVLDFKTKIKKPLTILVVLMVTAGCNVQKSKDIIGVWSVTTHNNRETTDVNWEFKSENVFNLLEAINTTDTLFRLNENGTWNTHKKRLTITLTGERIHGKLQLFSKPQIIRYLILKEESDFILTPVDANWEKINEAINLRLIGEN